MWKVALVLVVACVLETGSVWVCKGFPAENCYDNGDDKRNLTQAVQNWNFTAEENTVVTKDGYHIKVVRVYKNITKTAPIIIGHGIMMNGGGFTLQGKKSLAYVLADQGYEVWLLNFRGTTYSDTHNTLSSNSYPFWDFSFHEMGIYDLRETVDLVYNRTGQKSTYIGYSMGNHAGFVYGSQFPQEAATKLTSIVAQSPVAYYFHQKSWAQYLIPFMPMLMTLDKTVFNGRFFDVIKTFAPLCTIGDPFTLYFCHGLTALIFGDDYEQIDLETYPVFFYKGPDSIATKNLNHMFQIARTEVFKQYDYGPVENMLRYKQLTPPLYKLGDILVPVSQWFGPNDWIATNESAMKINSELRPENRCKINVIPWPKWTHLDILCAKDIETLLYQSFIPEIDLLASGTCTK